jgi:hypothetical protein
MSTSSSKRWRSWLPSNPRTLVPWALRFLADVLQAVVRRERRHGPTLQGRDGRVCWHLEDISRWAGERLAIRGLGQSVDQQHLGPHCALRRLQGSFSRYAASRLNHMTAQETSTDNVKKLAVLKLNGGLGTTM